MARQFKITLDVTFNVDSPDDIEDQIGEIISEIENQGADVECSEWADNPKVEYCDLCSNAVFEDDLICCEDCGCMVCDGCIAFGETCHSCEEDGEDDD